ncbi:MAG: hypothetical protein JNK60_08900 [Acidobacteria bacterium]|nr:hypothetical protein [Acidobacteriota bacterium]
MRYPFGPGALLFSALYLASWGCATVPAPRTFQDALQQALQGRTTDLEIEVASREQGPYRVLEIWGDGTGLENGERQFRLGPADVKRAVRAFEGIDALSEGAASEAAPGNGPMVLWKARIRIAGFERVALRHSKNRPLPGLDGIVKEVSAVCEPALANAITVRSIPEGLDGIAAGRVSPRALTLQFTALEEVPTGDGARPGFMVSFRGRNGILTLSDATGSRPPVPFTLTEDELRALVSALRTAAPETYPAALSSARYEQLVVTVLGHQRDLQARRFADLDPSTTKTAQASYEVLRAHLERLVSRIPAGRPERR